MLIEVQRVPNVLKKILGLVKTYISSINYASAKEANYLWICVISTTMFFSVFYILLYL